MDSMLFAFEITTCLIMSVCVCVWCRGDLVGEIMEGMYLIHFGSCVTLNVIALLFKVLLCKKMLLIYHQR